MNEVMKVTEEHRNLTKQDSDVLHVSDEKKLRQSEDFTEAKTFLYEF